jgi:hypothetical protein
LHVLVFFFCSLLLVPFGSEFLLCESSS